MNLLGSNGPVLALTGGADHPHACRLLKVDRQCFRRGRSSRAELEVEFPSSMNVHYSVQSLSVVPHSQHRMAQAPKCRGDLTLIVASDYLMQAAGALPPSTVSPKLVHYRVRLAPRRDRESRRIVGVRVYPGGRLDRSRRLPAVARGAAAGILRSKRAAMAYYAELDTLSAGRQLDQFLEAELNQARLRGRRRS